MKYILSIVAVVMLTACTTHQHYHQPKQVYVPPKPVKATTTEDEENFIMISAWTRSAYSIWNDRTVDLEPAYAVKCFTQEKDNDFHMVMWEKPVSGNLKLMTYQWRNTGKQVYAGLWYIDEEGGYASVLSAWTSKKGEQYLQTWKVSSDYAAKFVQSIEVKGEPEKLVSYEYACDDIKRNEGI